MTLAAMMITDIRVRVELCDRGMGWRLRGRAEAENRMSVFIYHEWVTA